MMTDREIFIALVRSAITGGDVPELPEELHGALRIAGEFDLAHIIAVPLGRAGRLNGETGEAFKKKMYDAISRSYRFDVCLNDVHSALDSAGIDHIFLKGAVLREKYPEKWMRTSTDLDVLIREGDRKSALGALNAAGFRLRSDDSYHAVTVSQSGLPVEVHTRLLEDFFPSSSTAAGAWESAHAVGEHRFELSEAMFYFYSVAHLEKHFVSGGCGVRPFIDLWLMNKTAPELKTAAEKLISEAGLAQFCEGAEKLARVWLGGEEYDELSLLTEEYILSAGQFGNNNTRLAADAASSGGTVRHLIKRAFPPKERLWERYPVLKKHGAMLPLVWAMRLYSNDVTSEAVRVIKADKSRLLLSGELFSRLGIK